MGLFSRYKIPRGETAQSHAQSLIYLAQYHVAQVNNAQSVFNLYYSYNQLSGIVGELIWLNEKKNVPMFPSPRSNWNEIERNLGSTIDRFIDFYLRRSARFGEGRAKVIEELIAEIENTDGFTEILRQENEERIIKLKEEAASIREEIRMKYQAQCKEETLNALGIKKNIDASSFHPFEVNDRLENTIKQLYRRCLNKGTSTAHSRKVFFDFKQACETSILPLASEIWLESLLAEYEPKFTEQNPMQAADTMDGRNFELWCASLLERIGFLDVVVTKASGDYGVDLLAYKDGIKYAIQCKRYASNLGNAPVQEVNSGKAIYNCHVGAVMTNQHFTKSAKELAERNGVLLWDRDWITAMLKSLEEI